MLEKVVLDQVLDREQYRARLPALEQELFDIQRKAKEARIPTVIVFEGWEAAGKGTSIGVFTERLDPRALKVHPIQPARGPERERPWLWRFWMRLPNRGEIAIFDTSWYRHVLLERIDKLVKRREWEEAFHEINEFEHALVDDGHVLVKFWLHISKKEQAKRFRRAEKDPTAFWRVTPECWEQNRRYEKWLDIVEEMLERTETEWAPWTIVESTCRRFSRIKILERTIEMLRARIEQVAPQLLLPPALPGQPAAASAPSGAAPKAGTVFGTEPTPPATLDTAAATVDDEKE